MKRVMILSKLSLLWWGVQRTLQDADGCDLVAWETHLDPTLESICKLRPDVVLMDRGQAGTDNASLILRILGQRPGTCVIVLSLEDNTLSLYRQERHTIGDVEDLLRVIQDPVMRA